ncbi:hypothetical protein ACIQV3_23320 [Streptomyces sp. NPDC099050]|uniref:hypothetical protein n=1 Tax=Streptomyces sp. NPDC099050 TaxID=3366100 RepID=UPI003800C128
MVVDDDAGMTDQGSAAIPAPAFDEERTPVLAGGSVIARPFSVGATALSSARRQ